MLSQMTDLIFENLGQERALSFNEFLFLYLTVRPNNFKYNYIFNTPNRPTKVFRLNRKPTYQRTTVLIIYFYLS